MGKLPTISFIIPTFNEERNIARCLKSIAAQKYPKTKVETIVVDDSSTDSTTKIAKSYDTRVLTHKNRHGEVGKMLGFRKTTGEFAIYLDADVELKGVNWIQKMLTPLLEDGEIIGAFTRKYSRKSDPPLERYYSFDPLQRDSTYKVFSPDIEDTVVEKRKGYDLLNYTDGSIPPSGRCLYRRKELLELVKDYDMFLELDFLVLLSRNNYNRFAYVPSAGLYHHHAPSIGELMRKRKYNVQNVYLKTYDEKLYRWFSLSDPKNVIKISSWIIFVYLIFPSVIIGIYKSIKHRDWAGMYEPIVNFVVVSTIIIAFLKI